MLILKRTNKQPEYTQGELYIDNKYFCDTLEPTDRGLKKDDPTSLIKQVKIPSKTAIPSGLYKISYDIKSPKYSNIKYYKDFCDGKMPRLLDTKGFDGILIHPGNWVSHNSQNDSDGCILVGKWNKDHLINSRITWEKLYNLKQSEIKIE